MNSSLSNYATTSSLSSVNNTVSTHTSEISGIQSNLTAINDTMAGFNPSTFTGIQNNVTNINDSIVMRQSTTGNTIGAVINSLDNHTANPNNIIFAVLGNGSTNNMMPHFWIQNGASSQASGCFTKFYDCERECRTTKYN